MKLWLGSMFCVLVLAGCGGSPDPVSRGFNLTESYVKQVRAAEALERRVALVADLQQRLHELINRVDAEDIEAHPGRAMSLALLKDQIDMVPATPDQRRERSLASLKAEMTAQYEPRSEQVPENPEGSMHLAFDLLEALYAD